jgi:hypothetical protein
MIHGMRKKNSSSLSIYITGPHGALMICYKQLFTRERIADEEEGKSLLPNKDISNESMYHRVPGCNTLNTYSTISRRY